MTGAESAVASTAIAIFREIAPKGWRWIKTQIWGKQVLVVGPTKAGKTTFVSYLQYGFFNPEKPTERTQNPEPGHKLYVRVGERVGLAIDINAVWDLPGDFGARYQAFEAFRKNPDAIIAITDLTRPEDESRAWLEEFLRNLDMKWRVRGRRSNRLKWMRVVLNKSDKVDDQAVVDREKTYLDIVRDDRYPYARGQMAREILVTPCTLVRTQTKPDPVLVNALVQDMALALAG